MIWSYLKSCNKIKSKAVCKIDQKTYWEKKKNPESECYFTENGIILCLYPSFVPVALSLCLCQQSQCFLRVH